MVESKINILIGAFVLLIISLVLIQVIGDSIQSVSTGSIAISNESITLTAVTITIPNETVTMTGGTNISTGTLVNNYLTILTELRNESSEIITTFCNVTLGTGALVCNATNSTIAYAEYTYNDNSIGATAQDELIAVSECRNFTAAVLTADTHCNVTLTTGAVRVNYDNVTTTNIAYLDYTYIPDNYVRGAATRQILFLTILFFALFILSIGIIFVVKGFKDSGMDFK